MRNEDSIYMNCINYYKYIIYSTNLYQMNAFSYFPCSILLIAAFSLPAWWQRVWVDFWVGDSVCYITLKILYHPPPPAIIL